LRKEFAALTAKSATQEKENELLIKKITELSIKVDENEELLKEKVNLQNYMSKNNEKFLF
jgi:hypothetical protein